MDFNPKMSVAIAALVGMIAASASLAVADVYVWNPTEGMILLPAGIGSPRIINNSGVVYGINGSRLVSWSAANGLTDLGRPPEFWTMNHNGVVAGRTDWIPEANCFGAFTWSAATGATVYPLDPVDYELRNICINDSAEIAGTKGTGDGMTTAFCSSSAIVPQGWESMSDDPYYGTRAFCINNDGEVLGIYTKKNQVIDWWRDANGNLILENGQPIIRWYTYTYERRVFLADSHGYADLGPVADFWGTNFGLVSAVYMNNACQIAYTVSGIAKFYDPTAGVTQIGTGPGMSLLSLNESGQALGDDCGSPFIWSAQTGVQYLNFGAGMKYNPVAMNDHGAVVGVVESVPEPASAILLLVMVIAGCGRAPRRCRIR